MSGMTTATDPSKDAVLEAVLGLGKVLSDQAMTRLTMGLLATTAGDKAGHPYRRAALVTLAHADRTLEYCGYDHAIATVLTALTPGWTEAVRAQLWNNLLHAVSVTVDASRDLNGALAELLRGGAA